MNKLVEDIVICVVVALGLLISCFFLVATVAWGHEYPPTAIGAFLGIAIATLIYRFLDGGQTSEFSIGALKLGGSAALLFAFTYFGGKWIANDQQLYSETAQYRDRIGVLEEHITQQDGAIASRDGTILDLRKQLREMPDSRRALTLAEIRSLSPNDTLVRRLRQMVIGQEPPFAAVISTADVPVSVVSLQGRGPRYTICPATLAGLAGEDGDIHTELRISRTPDGAGDAIHVTAARNGTIADNVCSAAETDFEVQINCEAALDLFPDRITECAESGVLRGETVTIGSLPL